MSSIGEQFGVKGRRKMLRADVPGRAQAIRMWTLTSKSDSTIERLEKGYLDALSSVDLAENIGKQLHADTRYTVQGRQDQYRDHILHQAVPVFHQGRRAISRAKQELDRMRARLQLPKADPADAAGAIAKMELRTWLRGLPQVERDKITRAENLGPQVRAAIIEAALALTGVADSHLGVLKEKVLREVHGSLIDDIAQLEDAISVATSAVEAGRESVHIDTGMTIEQFNAAAAPIEQRQKVAWLRRGRVVDSSTVLSVSVPAACSARSASTR
ncbi:hypothetical protein J2R76_003455 [Bradyrhizobium sp. USDA 4532]|uniref:hypothetical protein n=1 Tax=unclassified Bradyrhizobium TaxID=2631580 RepID=UPI0020A0F4BD|nr:MULTISPECIES: hypothetical protein [unclassified Bradyrhizobium]MCP1835119.1 hypothetical protein [Bradyrhizobium sp. USDA 4545]MCP1919864.1 hypothetical protein [Bradyrhizobium sp. USDA 4532]